MKYEDMTVDQLTAELERLDAERLKLREQGRAIMAVRQAKMHAAHCAEWGVSVEEYDATKKQAKETDAPISFLLNKLRKKKGMPPRVVQTGTATPVGK